jgi:hypothetical protein
VFWITKLKKNPKFYHGTGCLRIVFGNKLQKWRISVKKITVKINFAGIIK